jgi:hypothetical protein
MHILWIKIYLFSLNMCAVVASLIILRFMFLKFRYNMAEMNNIPCYHFDCLHFGVYTSKEIKALSVKEVTNPQTFDSLSHPTYGGLYDPALGKHHVHHLKCSSKWCIIVSCSLDLKLEGLTINTIVGLYILHGFRIWIYCQMSWKDIFLSLMYTKITLPASRTS